MWKIFVLIIYQPVTNQLLFFLFYFNLMELVIRLIKKKSRNCYSIASAQWINEFLFQLSLH